MADFKLNGTGIQKVDWDGGASKKEDTDEVARYETVEWEPVDALDETERGTGGFGHSDAKEYDTFASERELLYRVLFDLRNEVNELKKEVAEIRKDDPKS